VPARQTDRDRNRHTDRDTDSQRDRNRHTDRDTDSQRDRRTDRHEGCGGGKWLRRIDRPDGIGLWCCRALVQVSEEQYSTYQLPWDFDGAARGSYRSPEVPAMMSVAL